MNSSLQSLIRVPSLLDYFTSGKYKKGKHAFITTQYYIYAASEINVDNPLGMKGKIVEAFAEVVNEVMFSYIVTREVTCLTDVQR